jgi:hypothetical protein
VDLLAVPFELAGWEVKDQEKEKEDVAMIVL